MAAGRPSKRQEAIRWLRSFLSQGSRPESEVKAAASGQGISPATLNRVKASLGIESIRRGAGYHWRDPDVLEEQTGSPNLVAAIQELTKAVKTLARHHQGPAEQTPPTPPAEEAFTSGPFDIWTEEDYRGATLEELIAREKELQESLAYETKSHGETIFTPDNGIQKVDRSKEIESLQVEIKRASGWYISKADERGVF